MGVSKLLVKMGAKIRTIRMEKNITQDKLAQACGFQKASMSRIESGKSNPTVHTLYKICSTLEVQLKELCSDEGNV